MPARPPSPPRSSLLAVRSAEAIACLRFYTRLPLPPLAVEAAHPPEPFARCLAFAPLAGAVVGLFGAGAVLGAAALGLPPAMGAALALLSTVLVSGGLHEDGLADCADGFGGGSTRERKLEIMRDSRLGTFGALAVAFSLLLRTAALAALWDRGGPGLAAAALVAGAGASRGLGLLPIARLAPARADGLGHGAGRLPRGVFPAAAAGALAVGLALPPAAGVPLPRSVLALGLSALTAAATTRLARAQLGGVTGDVAGACQQACEFALLLGLLIAPGGG